MIISRYTTYVAGVVVAAALVGTGLYLYQRPHISMPALPYPKVASTPQPGAGPAISDASRIELLNAFVKALMYGNDQQRRMQELCQNDSQCKGGVDMTQRAVDEWNRTVQGVVVKEKLPAGTGFNVDVGTGRVNVVVPAPAPVPAPK